MRNSWPMAVAVFLAAASAIAAEPAAQITRTILDRHDLSGNPGKEVVLGTAELPAGAVVGWHVHHGDEAGYVLKGTLLLKVRGRPDRLLKAGDSFFNEEGAVHSVSAPTAEGGTAVSTWIIEKGKPLAEPVE